MKLIRKLVSLLLIIAVFSSCLTVISVDAKASDIPKSILEVHFIDVGQGDCTLIKCGTQTMLIDAGDNNQGTKIQLYLKKQGIKKIDYFVITHPDADHCGGADVILYKFDCQTIIMPDCTNDTNTYRDVVDTMKYKRYKTTYPVVGQTYTLGTATFTILGPTEKNAEINNNSVALLLKNGNNSFLFTGDAEFEEERCILNTGLPIKCDVMHIAHHGSASATSDEFLVAAAPKSCVISCGKENKYGHPHSDVVNKIRNMGCSLYRTDEQGNIIAVSDGINMLWSCNPSTTWLSGDATINSSYAAPIVAANETALAERSISDQQEDVDYVANKNTHKFHYSWCGSVTDMKEKNKLYFNGTRDELINQGYVPCKRCNP